MDYPLVSIIIPMLNAEAFIQETIHSAIHQTYKNTEIIVVDNGSTDNSMNLIQHLSGQIQILTQKVPGASAARNLGIKNASGEFIQFLDADDILHPDKIVNQVNQLKNEPWDTLSFGKWIRFFQIPEEGTYQTQKIDKNYPEPYKLLKEIWNGKGMVQPGAYLASKRLILKAGLWNESLNLNDDGEYFCRVILASSKIQFCETSTVYYRSGLINSLSKRKTIPAVTSHLRSLEYYVKSCINLPFFNELRAPLALVFSDFIYQYYQFSPDICEQAKKDVAKLGYNKLPVTGGRYFRIMATLIGFENTLQVRNLMTKLKKILLTSFRR